jgi:hypothetical protein
MIFKVCPDIKKQFDTVYNFGLKNLIVSGCSFTYNNHATSATTWPYYLRDLGGFEQVLDCSLIGAGNHHISNSLLWALTNDRPDPKESLIVVMWSGCDRDDYICPVLPTTNQYPFKFNYSDVVCTELTGGFNNDNTIRAQYSNQALQNLAKTKTHESRAIENYLYIANTWHCLKNLGYKFIFLDFLDVNLPSRTRHFDIKKYLPDLINQNLDQMIESVMDLHTYALKNDLLSEDDFHPTPNGHLGWTKQVLIPHLKTLIDL